MIYTVKDLINPSSFELEEKCLNEWGSSSFYIYKCPKCGSYHIVRNGTYKRKITFINKDLIIKVKQITIQKYFCKRCCRSFNHLPICVPRFRHISIYSTLLINLIEGSVNSISKLFTISRSSIRNILKRSETDLNKLKVIISKYHLESLEESLRKFNDVFSYSLFSLSTI